MAITTQRKPKQKKADLKTGREIRIEDLQIGMKIVTSWHKPKEIKLEDIKLPAESVFWDEADILEYLDGLMAAQERFVNKSIPVKQIDECPGKWRTHIHVNRNMCYDMRCSVWVVNE